MDDASIAAAGALLKKVKRLHVEAGRLEARRAAKVQERNALIVQMDPTNEKSPYSVTDISKHLGVTFPAIRKILDKAKS